MYNQNKLIQHLLLQSVNIRMGSTPEFTDQCTRSKYYYEKLFNVQVVIVSI